MDETALAKSRTRSLLEHFAVVADTRQPWKVMYLLSFLKISSAAENLAFQPSAGYRS